VGSSSAAAVSAATAAGYADSRTFQSGDCGARYRAASCCRGPLIDGARFQTTKQTWRIAHGQSVQSRPASYRAAHKPTDAAQRHCQPGHPPTVPDGTAGNPGDAAPESADGEWEWVVATAVGHHYHAGAAGQVPVIPFTPPDSHAPPANGGPAAAAATRVAITRP
jgi:hypothetical protein